MQSIFDLIFSYNIIFTGIFFDFFTFMFPIFLIYFVILFFMRW